MDRVEIKSLAKEKIKGNLWKIWKPMLLLAVVIAVAECVGQTAAEKLGLLGALVSLVLSCAIVVVST